MSQIPLETKNREPDEVVDLQVLFPESTATFDGLTVTGATHFPTVCPKGGKVYGGKWYYEIILHTDGCLQIGWGCEQLKPGTLKDPTTEGLGDNEFGFAFDGLRHYKWNGEPTVDPNIPRWNVGDRLGFSIDVPKLAAHYFVNGKKISRIENLVGSDYYFPCASASHNQKYTFVFGDQCVFIPSGYEAIRAKDFIPKKAAEELPNSELYTELSNLAGGPGKFEKILDDAFHFLDHDDSQEVDLEEFQVGCHLIQTAVIDYGRYEQTAKERLEQPLDVDRVPSKFVSTGTGCIKREVFVAEIMQFFTQLRDPPKPKEKKDKKFYAFTAKQIFDGLKDCASSHFEVKPRTGSKSCWEIFRTGFAEVVKVFIWLLFFPFMLYGWAIKEDYCAGTSFREKCLASLIFPIACALHYLPPLSVAIYQLFVFNEPMDPSRGDKVEPKDRISVLEAYMPLVVWLVFGGASVYAFYQDKLETQTAHSVRELYNSALAEVLQRNAGVKYFTEVEHQQFRFDHVFGTKGSHAGRYFFIAFPLALAHCLIPGLFRQFYYTEKFVGNSPAEMFIVLANLSVSFIMYLAVFIGLQVVIHCYWTLYYDIRSSGAILEPHEARLNDLPCYLDITQSGNNVRFWLLLREVAKKQGLSRLYQPYVGLLVVVQFGLLVAFIVRYVFLQKSDIDIFTVLGVYDTLTIAGAIFLLILAVMRCNERSHSHVRILHRIKFNHSLRIAREAEGTMVKGQEAKAQQRGQHGHQGGGGGYEGKSQGRLSITSAYEQGSMKQSAQAMLDQALEQVTHFDDPVKILGLTVDAAFMFRASGLLAGGVLSMIAQIVSTSKYFQ